MLQLNDKIKQIAQAQGFLSEWLKDAPVQARAAFDTVSQGVDYYREQAVNFSQDFDRLQLNYNNLSVLTGTYLEELNGFRTAQEAYQKDEQREFHTKEEKPEDSFGGF